MSYRSNAPGGPFEHLPPYREGADTGSFLPADFASQYEQLFAEALEEGEISDEERQRLNLAAAALGLDAERVTRLENALLAAYEGHASITLAEPADPSALGENAPETEEPAPSEGFDDRPTPIANLAAKPIDENEALHERFLACGQMGHIDAQVCTAAVLVQRSVATNEERRVHEAYRTHAPPRPARALTTEAWARLFHPDEDRATGDIFAVIASAALLGRVSAMRRDRSLPVLDPEKRHEPMSSTVSAVRAVAWAAATLGMRPPPIYVAPEDPLGFTIVTAVPPVLRIGAPMLAGQSAIQLAFHGARHMTWFREEHFVCTLVPSIVNLEDLFLAALMIGAPHVELPSDVRARVALTAEAIVPVLDAPRLEWLRAHVGRFLAEGGRTSLRRWAQAAEWTALRAGLLLCGDLAAATEIVRREPNAIDRIRELERFWSSEDATYLRGQLGVAAIA